MRSSDFPPFFADDGGSLLYLEELKIVPASIMQNPELLMDTSVDAHVQGSSTDLEG